jgi:predicted nucleotidyltransferase
MDNNIRKLPAPHQQVIDRFVKACQADHRIVAAFLGGSYARGAADEYSDLDLYLITTDEGFENFSLQRDVFLHLLGDPLFLENFDIPSIVFYMLADGTEGELGFGRESDFEHIHSGPYTVLVDKKNILRGVIFTGKKSDPGEQTEKLRRLIYWFWHDLSHFITAMGRGQLWWAQGQLEALRRFCVNLARLQYNFSDAEVGDEPYFKIEKVLPVEVLAPLQTTFCPLEKGAMLKAGFVILHFYKELATSLAQKHGFPYPDTLEQIMVQRLEDLRAHS